jgi:hypothetical protein
MSGMEAELGQLYDNINTGGESVINTPPEGSIQPDTRPRPDDERPIDQWHRESEEHKARSDALEARVRDSYDKAIAKQQREEELNPSMPANMQGVEAAAEWMGLPAEDRRIRARFATELENMVAAARQSGIEVKSAADVRALQQMLGADRTKPEGLSEPLKQLAPNAKTDAEAVAPYLDFERAYQQRGVDAFIEAARTRGHQLLDTSNPQHMSQAALQAYGVPIGAVMERCGYVPVEEVDTIRTVAIINDFAATKPDFQQVRQAMAAHMRSPAWKERAGESQSQQLERAYQAVKRGKKSRRMDATIEAEGDRLFGARAA